MKFRVLFVLAWVSLQVGDKRRRGTSRRLQNNSARLALRIASSRHFQEKVPYRIRVRALTGHGRGRHHLQLWRQRLPRAR